MESMESRVFRSPTHSSSLLQELQRMRETGTLCDVTLQVGECCVPAHRIVLAAASPFFAGMFVSDMRESRSGIVQLPKLDPCAVKSLVEFAYSSQISFYYARAPQLLVAADMLQFSEVKQAYCAYLTTCLDPTHCLDLMQFADLHTCPELYRAARLHCRLHFRAVSKQPVFLEMEYEHLEPYLSSDHLCVEGEEDVLEAALRWLDHETDSRSHYAHRVLCCVRLSLLSPGVLLDRVWTHQLIAASPECMELVRRALSTQLSPTSPRTLSDKVTACTLY